MYPYCLNFDNDDEGVYQAEYNKPLFPGPPDGNPDFGRRPEQRQRPPEQRQRPPEPRQRPPEPGQRPPEQGRRPPEPWPRHGKYPPAEPPVFIPERPVGPRPFAVDPGAAAGCINNYTYIWLANGLSFWMYITFIGRTSVAGYRWTRFGWIYTGLDLKSIESFSCSIFGR